MIFKKLKLGKMILKNRIVVSPMCQYSSNNGSPSSWHYQHLGKLALSGASKVMIESTAVNKIGKITDKDLCLFNDTHENNFKKLLNFIRDISNIKVGIQISHAGRKGSAKIPWEKKNTPLINKDKWQTVAPSPIKKDKKWPIPYELSIKKINKLKVDYKNCSIRAKKIGFDCLEIHMAHGYLLHEFFSPISNFRKDKYGGNLVNRARLLIEIAKIVRDVWPKNRILGARITGTDHMERGISISDSKFLVKKLEEIGFDYICVSSGGIISKTKLKSFRGFRTNIASKIKKTSKIKIRTSGMLGDLSFIEKILKEKKCDFVAVGRKFLLNPQWLQKTINGKKFSIPNQYKRG